MSLDELNEEFLNLMNAPADSDLKVPVDDKAKQEILGYLVDAAHHARLCYIRIRSMG